MKMSFRIVAFLFIILPLSISAQNYNQIDESGNVTMNGEQNQNFNPHSNDTTKKSKVVPKGLRVWTVDRKFGDVIKAEVDTMPHLYPNTTLSMGKYGQYNTIGSNYLARQNRIFIDRPAISQFFFTDAYDQSIVQPDQLHFTNTLSPITNLSYDNCGDKTDGEDHLKAIFAANFGKRLGIGFNIDYQYARGYFQDQSASHFDATFFTSYIGDQYQLHAIFSTYHEKASENGGITDDNYITHPEVATQTAGQSYSDNEIPTILNSNWNRNDHLHFFLTHRYSLGFYRKVKMTDEEIKAREFAQSALQDTENSTALKKNEEEKPAPQGRPDDAVIAGDLPTLHQNDSQKTDTTRIKVDSKATADSLLAIQAAADSLEALMKREFVPVTSFIHTLDLNDYDHKYQAYYSPTDYYANTYFNRYSQGFSGDSIYDQVKMFNMRNTFAIALLEGFNKYVPAGLKAFITYDLRRYRIPEMDADGMAWLQNTNEHCISIGGQLRRTLGQTFHYNLQAETWLTGEDAGQLKLEGETDLNFPLFGDTVHLAAKAYFYRLSPSFFERHYHGKHFWWDNTLSKPTRTRIEGIFSYDKTNTTLRVAIEEIQNYTYLGMSYTRANNLNTGMTATIHQHSGNINILTAQLDQKLKAGPLHWDNIITYQSSSEKDILPLPTLNVFSNLYLDFMVAHVLKVELGASATWFTKYKAPDFCPALNQFAIQENEDSRVEVGNFPFVDVYANLHLKHARFFVLMNNVTGKSLNRQEFLVPHYPMNRSVLHFGVSWNFFN
ncbi:MAG: putative porin [Prevotella sp.]|nr:putative porin [Prevotella sp.]